VPAAELLREQRMQQILDAGPDGKAEAARWRLLNDPDGMARLHHCVWQEPQYQVWRDTYRQATSDSEPAKEAEAVAH